MKQIDNFRGPYRWLSNFERIEIVHEGFAYPSTEHAFQAAKTHDLTEKEKIRTAKTCREAKHLGNICSLREDWEKVKNNVMYEINRYKFEHYPHLKKKLLDTGNIQLIEKNTWMDTYWGVCNGKGENWLGKILMRIRKELQENAK